MIGLGGDIKSLYLHCLVLDVYMWEWGPSTRVNLPS